MKAYVWIFLVAMTLTSTAQAALPPLYQSTSEIRSILIDEQLGQKLQSGELITDIKRNEQGYEIITNQHRLQISVCYLQDNRPGPAKFSLHFGEPLPLNAAH